MNKSFVYPEKLAAKAKKIPHSFFYQAVHTIISKGGLLIIGILTGIITARVLGPEGKGLLAMFQVLPGMVLAFGSLGVRQSTAYLIGQKKYDEKDIQASMMALYFISVSISLTVILIGYWSLGFFKYGFLISLIFALMGPIALLQGYSNGLLLGRKQIEKINYIQIINSGGGFILIMLFVAWFKWGVIGAGTAFLLAQCAAVFLLLIWVSQYASLMPRWVSPIPKEMLKNGIMFALSLFVLNLNYRIDILMLGKMQTEVSVGIYSVGVNICELLNQLPLAVGVVLFSHSTNWQSDQMKSNLQKVAFLSRVILILVFSSAMFLSAISWWVIPFFYGEAFQDSAKVVWYLLPGVIMLTIFITLQLFIAGQGRPEIALYTFGPALILNIILNFCLIPNLNYIGAALSSTISYSFAMVLYFIIFNARYKIKFLDFIFLKKMDFNYLLQMLKVAIKK